MFSSIVGSRAAGGASGDLGAALLFVSFIAAGLGNLAFNSIASRWLGPASFSAVAAMTSVLLVISLPLAIVQVVVARQSAQRRLSTETMRAAGRPCGGRLVRTGAAIGTVIGAVLLLVLPKFGSYLHLRSWLALACLAIAVVPMVVGTLLRGLLLGELSYRPVAIATVLGTGAELCFAVAALRAGFGASGALAAIVVGEVVTTLLLLISGRHLTKRGHGAEIDIPPAAVCAAVGSFMGFWVLATLDVVLARHRLPAAIAGSYSAAAAVARIALFLPLSVASAAYPRFTNATEDAAHRLEQRLEIAVLGLGLAAGGALVLLRHLVVSILFGGAYHVEGSVLLPLLLTAAVLGVVNLRLHYLVARGRRRASTCWLGVVLLAACASVTIPGAAGLARLTVVASVVALVAGRIRRAVPPGQGLPGWRLADAELDLTVVVPFYNPGELLRRNMFRLIEVLRHEGIRFEVITVADGCTDGSEHTIAGVAPSIVRQIVLDRNEGKGQALRTGLLLGRGRYLGFIDADGDLDPELWVPFLRLSHLYQPDMVIGSKRHPLSEVHAPRLRRLYSWGYRRLVRMLFRLPAADTQVGIKLVRRDVMGEVLPRTMERRFAFDLELLAVASRLGFRRVFEAPVRIDHQYRSTVTTRDVARTFVETLGIAWRSRIRHVYDRATPTAAARWATLQALRTGAQVVDRAPGTVSARPVRLLAPAPPAPRRIVVFTWKDMAHPLAGGAEIYSHEVLRRWVAWGHTVTLITSSVGGRPPEEIVDGVRVVRQGSLLTTYARAKRFYGHELRGQVDLVIDQINTRPFGCAGWVDDAAVVALIYQVARDAWTAAYPWPLAVVGRHWLEPRWLRAYRDLPVLTISASSRASLADYGLQNVVIVPVGLELPSTMPVPVKENVPTIAVLGRLARTKQVDHALAAFAELRRSLPDARLWIIGSGPDEARLRKLAPDGVTFFGHVSEHEKYLRLSSAHALVATSCREGWALTVDEAAAVGTPTMGYDVCGLRDSVPAAKGVLVRPNAAALADGLLTQLPAWTAAPARQGWRGGAMSWDTVAAVVLQEALEAWGMAADVPLAPSDDPESQQSVGAVA